MKQAVKRRDTYHLDESLTPELITAICSALRIGATFDVACQLNGVPPWLGQDWFKRGAQERKVKGRLPTLFKTFRQQVSKASADGEVRYLTRISEASERDWKAAAWALERRWSNRWGRSDVIRHQIDPINESEIQAESVSEEVDSDMEIERCIRALTIYQRTASSRPPVEEPPFDPEQDPDQEPMEE